MANDSNDPDGIIKTTLNAGGTYVDQRVSSINQTGGITANTVNIGHQPRIITQHQGDQVVEAIKADPGQAMILVMSGTPDGADFSADMVAVLTMAGWGANSGARMGKPFKGVVAYPHSKRGEAAAQAFKDAGISIHIEPTRPGPLTDGDLALIVGS